MTAAVRKTEPEAKQRYKMSFTSPPYRVARECACAAKIALKQREWDVQDEEMA